MLYNVIWSPNALIDVENIIHYLFSAWTFKEVDNFYRRIEIRIQQLQYLPKSNPVIRKKYRRALIDKNNLLIYKINKRDNTIEILHVFDGRQKPSKLKLK